MADAILPCSPQMIETAMHDQELSGDDFRLWLFLMSHAKQDTGLVTCKVSDVQRGTGMNRLSRTLHALNALIEGGYVVLLERHWTLGRLTGLELRIANRTDSSKPKDKKVAVYPVQR